MNVYASRLRARVTSSVAAVLLWVSGCAQEGPADEVGGDDESDDSDPDSEESDDEIGDESGTEEGSESSDGEDTGSEDESDTGSDSGESDSGSDSSSDSDSGDESDTGTGTDSGDETGTEDGDDTGTEDGGTGTDDSGSESGSDSGSTEPECIEDGDCEGETPYCEANVCVDCTGLVTEDCADKNAATPACRESDGVCVQCTPEEDDACMGTTPVCDNYVCRGCEEHDECTVACNLDTGGCIEGDALHVDKATCAGGTEDGSVDNPFCNVTEAVGEIGVGQTRVIVIHADTTPYVETASLTIAGNRTAVLLGDGDPVIWQDSQPVLTAINGSTVFGSGLQLGGSGSPNGVDCSVGARVWLDDSEVSANTGDGINTQDCELYLRRTTVSMNNAGDGVRATGGTVTLQDVTITGSGASGVNMAIGGTLNLSDVTISGSTSWGVTSNGTSITGTRVQVLDNDAGGINLTNGSELTLDTSIIGGNGGNGLSDTMGLFANGSDFDLLYVTVAGNLGSQAHHSIRCASAGTRTLRNSIVVSPDVDSVDCVGLTVTNSAVQDPDIVTDNTDVGAWNGTWFQDVGTGNNYHLGSAGAAFEDVARWQTDDPATDIDGNPRPTMNDDPDWAGADVPN